MISVSDFFIGQQVRMYSFKPSIRVGFHPDSEYVETQLINQRWIGRNQVLNQAAGIHKRCRFRGENESTSGAMEQKAIHRKGGCKRMRAAPVSMRQHNTLRDIRAGTHCFNDWLECWIKLNVQVAAACFIKWDAIDLIGLVSVSYTWSIAAWWLFTPGLNIGIFFMKCLLCTATSWWPVVVKELQ